MIDLVHVRSFVVLATELHFGRAARRLNMTQPPLSRQIKLLEHFLGTTLFDRTSQAVNLTPAGRNFLPEAQSLLQHAEDLTAQMRQVSVEPEGRVRMGFYGAASFRLLPRVMARMAQVYPRVQMILKEMNAAQQLEAFALGELDLGLARPTTMPAGLTASVALREPILLAMPRDYPLARRRIVRPADLQDQPFIAYGPEAPYMHSVQQAIFADHRVAPHIIQSLAHAQAILSLVGIGMGLALVSGDARHASNENIVLRTIPGLRYAEALTHILSRKDGRNPTITLVAELIGEVGKQLEDEN